MRVQLFSHRSCRAVCTHASDYFGFHLPQLYYPAFASRNYIDPTMKEDRSFPLQCDPFSAYFRVFLDYILCCSALSAFLVGACSYGFFFSLFSPFRLASPAFSCRYPLIPAATQVYRDKKCRSPMASALALEDAEEGRSSNPILELPYIAK